MGYPDRRGGGGGVTKADVPGRVYTQIGPWGLVPAWILDPDIYLPGVPDPSNLKKGKDDDTKPLSGSELRVYISLRTFSNQAGHCNPFVSTIADRAKVSKGAAEKAISKFKRLGWLETKQQHRPDGSLWRCDYYLRDVCPAGLPAKESPAPALQGGTRDFEGTREMEGTYPRNGGHGTREFEGARTHQRNTPEEQKGSEVECLPSGRSAPFGPGDDGKDPQPLILEAPATSRQGFEDWRTDDYELLVATIGSDKVVSDGSTSPAGTYPARAVYNALLKFPRGPKDWPGKYLATIAGNHPNGDLTEWLARFGLEAA